MIPSADGVEHLFVEVRGVRLHLAEAGAPGAPPVLCLHGWPHHHHCWAGVAARLGDRFRLLMPDWRGQGWSEDAPDGAYGPEVLAQDALALLDLLGIREVAVLGHDWGCYVAFLLAAEHPDRVRAVIGLSAPHPWVRPRPRALPGLWRGWYASLNAAGVGLDRTARHVLGDVPDDAVYLDRVRRPATTGLYRSYLRLLAEVPVRTPPPALTVPARYLCGTDDPCFPRALVDSPIPGAPPVEWVPGAAHSLPDTHPELVSERAAALFGP